MFIVTNNPHVQHWSDYLAGEASGGSQKLGDLNETEGLQRGGKERKSSEEKTEEEERKEEKEKDQKGSERRIKGKKKGVAIMG